MLFYKYILWKRNFLNTLYYITFHLTNLISRVITFSIQNYFDKDQIFKCILVFY